jgi:hypothetical protein
MDFWFKFFNIHMNGKILTCHDFHGFKWQNINVYPILTVFICDLTLVEINQHVTIPFATRFGNICKYKTKFQLFWSFSQL